MPLRAPKALMRTETTGAAISSASAQAATVQRDGQLRLRPPERTGLADFSCDVRLTRKFRPGASAPGAPPLASRSRRFDLVLSIERACCDCLQRKRWPS